MPRQLSPVLEFAARDKWQPEQDAARNAAGHQYRQYCAENPLVSNSTISSSEVDTGRGGTKVARSHTASSRCAPSASPPQSTFSSSGRAWETLGDSIDTSGKDIKSFMEARESERSRNKMARKVAFLGLASCLLIAATVTGCLVSSAKARNLRGENEEPDAPYLVGGVDAATADLQEVRAMAAAATASQVDSTAYTYVYFPGVGCTSSTLKRFQGVDSSAECRVLCDIDPRCGAYTYSTSGNEKCYLKADCATTKDKASNVSGVKGDLRPASGEEAEDEQENSDTDKSPSAPYGPDLVAEGDTIESPTYHAEEPSSSFDDTAPPGDFVMYTNMACRTDATVSFFNVELAGVYAYPWQCRRYCANHPACKAFTYDSVTSRCFYLRSCEGRFVNQAATSGVSASIDTGFDPTTAESPDTDEREEESSIENTEAIDESEGRHYAGEYSLYADAECVVEDVLDSQRDVPTVEACQAACDAFPGCGGFTYNPDRERCYLVQDCTERSSEGGNASGSKAVPSPIPVESYDDDDDDDVSPLTSTATNNASDDDDDSSTEAPIPPDDPSSVEEDAGSQASDNSVDNDDPPPNTGTSTTTKNPPEDEQSPVPPTDTDDEAEEEVAQEYPVYVSPIQYGNVDTSRYNLYPRTGCRGRSIDAKSGFDSVAECQAWCDENEDCRAFTLNVERSRCYLKHDCDDRKVEEDNISGAKDTVDRCAVSSSCATDDPDTVCPRVTAVAGEMDDAVAGAFEPPYWNISYVPTFDNNREYPMCDWKPPRDPMPKDWVDQCIENARGVGFLSEEKGRPNEECPAGWFLCKGMCYTLSQRNNRGPQRESDYYSDDFMFVESRCGLCGGARVAFVGDDPDMQRVAAEAANLTINEDKATWVRRFRFLPDRNPLVQNGVPFQPWHLYVSMYDDNKRVATYQRYYTGEKDDLDAPGWDKRFRNQEASILCVNTIPRIREAVRHSRESRLTMEHGCKGDDKDNMWDNRDHRWRPEQSNYPFPGH